MYQAVWEGGEGVGGGGTPIYKLYRYVRRQRVWFLCRFGLKMGIAFKDFGLKVWKQVWILQKQVWILETMSENFALK